jgi:hypothetical protein
VKMLDKIVDVHGWLSDKDFIWWPFSFLRPNPSTPMTFQLTCLMTICFAGLSSLMYALYSIVNNAFDAPTLFKNIMIFFALFFIWFNVVTKPLWNQRARRLK